MNDDNNEKQQKQIIRVRPRVFKQIQRVQNMMKPEYREGAVKVLLEQLQNTKSQSKRQKIQVKLKEWGHNDVG
jgi:hypothetical protein